jgi:hypothetical protein
MPVPPSSRRGGLRPGAGRKATPVSEDPDRFFIVLWRVISGSLPGELDLGHFDAGVLAAHLLSAEPILLATIEDGVLHAASTIVRHHADTLGTRIAALVRKARTAPAHDPWLAESEATIRALLLTALAFLRPDLTDEARERLNADAEAMRDQLRALGWTETLARVEERIRAAMLSNLPPRDSSLGRRAERLLRSRREVPKKK